MKRKRNRSKVTPIPSFDSNNLSNNSIPSSIDINTVQNHLLSILNHPSTFNDLLANNNFNELFQILENTLTRQENQSILLIGPNNNNILSIIKYVLSTIQNKYNPKGQNVLQVYLNGILHEDDNIAIREIMRQLRWEIEIQKEDSILDRLDRKHMRNR